MPESAIILLAEDREDDILLIRKAFAKALIHNPLQVVRDGEEVLAYLKGEDRFSNREEYPLPDLLLLDLKMPRMDGFEVIKWVRQQPGLSALRIVVLTASDNIRDVNTAYRLGANSFMVKPMDFENVMAMAQFLNNFWLRLAKSPELSRPAPNKDRTVFTDRKLSGKP